MTCVAASWWRRTRDYSAVSSGETVARLCAGHASVHEPPSRPAGRSTRSTSARNVWGLGALLYEILTGRAPFEGPTVMEVLRCRDQRASRCGERARALRASRSGRDRHQGVEQGQGCSLRERKADDRRRVRLHDGTSRAGLRIQRVGPAPAAFARRYRAGVVSAAAVLLVVLGALVVLSFAWRNESHRGEAERDARLRANHHLAQALATQAIRLLEAEYPTGPRASSLPHPSCTTPPIRGATPTTLITPRASAMPTGSGSTQRRSCCTPITGSCGITPTCSCPDESITPVHVHLRREPGDRRRLRGHDERVGCGGRPAPGPLQGSHRQDPRPRPLLGSAALRKRRSRSHGARVVGRYRTDPVAVSSTFSSSVHALAWSPDRKTIAVGERSGKLALLDAASLNRALGPRTP